ncbi:hypothetical protein TRAPUB_6428 [Trametes pubescens]|uniref:Uncharacterized protein n=1 Tax=Trametes pubescens TaxID=154538 RepID=A0A1M2V671_TRAPU|nr:hypothetical protein TRAPUB_6428 [Trametes pubescens]
MRVSLQLFLCLLTLLDLFSAGLSAAIPIVDPHRAAPTSTATKDVARKHTVPHGPLPSAHYVKRHFSLPTLAPTLTVAPAPTTQADVLAHAAAPERRYIPRGPLPEDLQGRVFADNVLMEREYKWVYEEDVVGVDARADARADAEPEQTLSQRLCPEALSACPSTPVDDDLASVFEQTTPVDESVLGLVGSDFECVDPQADITSCGGCGVLNSQYVSWFLSSLRAGTLTQSTSSVSIARRYRARKVSHVSQEAVVLTPAASVSR